ncbi:AAA family ATPase [Limnoglobus roseus]|uniref:MoxR family ATPase n=1 Tax=Limnoglobus roseus TaxID=2598579 RepID=A0A5C1ANM3_9BACT|nr:MoxR family ATPase [Limnoglobus roseus]QEL19723.1 MoxR family ATPase [Limnoglobus roseus]
MSAEAIKEELEGFRKDFQRLRQEIGKLIVGQDDIVEGTLAALIAGGHVLLEGVPGLGKTLLVRTIADSLHLEFRRVQFTPDLMPADLVGTNVVLDTGSGGRKFEFQRGPIFGNIVLADEINRATPKTQSALLEAMQEKHVTVGGQTYDLPKPFFVLATQNPLEMEGTYPLPEAQLDRFFFKLLVKFPTFEDLESILDRTTESKSPKAEAIFDGERINALAKLVRQIPVANEVRRYAIAVVMATHPDHELAAPSTKKYVRYGSSPRGAQAIILAAKLNAILDGRYHVAREDVRKVAPMALRHRLILNFEGQADGIPADDVVQNILNNVKEPAIA